MAEQHCRVSSEIELCYETFGDPTDPPMLMIMGLAVQMIAWPDDLCRELADRGFYVVRFDNRDAGKSTHVKGRPPKLRELAVRSKRPAKYTLADMAGDAAGLLRELDLAPAHVVGASMGGMIAQTLAARHPESVLSLTSIMSNTGNRWRGLPALRLFPMLLAKPAGGREETIERAGKVFKAIGSHKLTRDDDWVRDVAARSWDRDRDRGAPGRQLAAIVASGDRTHELRRITAPTLVIHGNDDPLVKPSGAKATVKAIPNARMLEIDGMGHDLPRAAWQPMIDAIVANTARAEPVLSRAAA